MRPSFNFPSARRLEQHNPWDDAGPAFDFEVEYARDDSECQTNDDYQKSDEYDLSSDKVLHQRNYGNSHYTERYCNSERYNRYGCDDWSERGRFHNSYRHRINDDHYTTRRRSEDCGRSHEWMRCSDDYYYYGGYQRSDRCSPRRLTREEWRRIEWKQLKKELREQRWAFEEHYCPHCPHCLLLDPYSQRSRSRDRRIRSRIRKRRDSNSIYSSAERSSICCARKNVLKKKGSETSSEYSSGTPESEDFTSFSQSTSFTNSSQQSVGQQYEGSETNDNGGRKGSVSKSGGEEKEDQLGSREELLVNKEINLEDDSTCVMENPERSEQLSGVQCEERRGLSSTGDTDFKSLEQRGSSKSVSTRSALPSSRFGAGDQYSAVILASKKEPAVRQGKTPVQLLTNLWELKVQSKIVYRYDVAVYIGIPNNQRAIDLLRGYIDDCAVVARRELCSDAVRYAFGYYHILSEGSAVIHDGGALLFSSEDLTDALKQRGGVLTIRVDELKYEYYRFVREDVRKQINSVTIEIVPCRDSASSFDMADLSAQSNRNWVTIDRSWKQFYELVTNHDAVLSGRFTQFGARSLFYCQPTSDKVGYGYERFAGARKGIKFIEGKRSDGSNIVPALVLDHRLGVFFKTQNAMASVREMDTLRDVEMFDFSMNEHGRMNNRWTELNQYLKGVRMNYGGHGLGFSFIASGISREPIKNLKDTLSNEARTEISLLAKYADTDVRINPNWPAVEYRTQVCTHYFPMELLEIAGNQRVSLEKQLLANSAPRADKPEVRLEKIHSLLEALNLHDNGSKNKFLRAFGIVVDSKPKEVLGFRRQPPAISFSDGRDCAMDDSRCNWRLGNDVKFVDGASADRIIIVHSDESFRLPCIVRDVLTSVFRRRGIRCSSFEAVQLIYRNMSEMEYRLEQVFKDNKTSSESLLIVFIDRLENKSHDFLKLMERKYLIPTQQITAEVVKRLPKQHQSCLYIVSKMNLKLGGFNYAVVPESFAHNSWIARGDTLVVGYDVTHPGKPSRDEIVNKMPPQRPSVVGFSFNGTAHPECFIGDYHFQTPRRERVEGQILNARFKWMLGLYSRHRGKWPRNILITRDGVSEGQYKMVVEEELGAIKEACEEFGRLNGEESWMPLFTVIIATKRHNARFFVQNGRIIENPKPTTVVDTDVVRNDITEFYMQSHRPLQGTAKATSYQVIVDENNMSSDEIQSLMLALTFHHQISDAPVSIPEPVYQADEWAKRGKDIWKAYTDRHNAILMKERGEYADYPIDFEAMTKRLAFWNTKLENRRVNA
ncbi:hypothetical protein Aduo_019104 [Ancylostoma duodenale]